MLGFSAHQGQVKGNSCFCRCESNLVALLPQNVEYLPLPLESALAVMYKAFRRLSSVYP